MFITKNKSLINSNCSINKAEPFIALPYQFKHFALTYFLDNFFRPNPNRPTMPEPNSKRVAGSGTGAVPFSELGLKFLK